MTETRRVCTREFKLEVLRLLETSGKSAARIERELGIGQGNIQRWKRKFAKDGADAFPGHGQLPARQDELQQLERENERLRLEREVRREVSHQSLTSRQMRFQFMESHREEYPIIRMCKVLDVSSSGYYAWRDRLRSARQLAS